MGRKIVPAAQRKIPLITVVAYATRVQVEQIAEREGVSLSEVTRRAIEQYVEHQHAEVS